MNNAFFEILRSGINSTLQDEGRFNQYHIGIPFSGAMDKRNYLISNHLVGNKKNAASLEFAYQGPLLKLKFGKVSFAIAGIVKFNIIRKNSNIEKGVCYKTFNLYEDDQIDIISTHKSVYGYLSIQKGFKGDYFWGSCSTNTKSEIGSNNGKKFSVNERIYLNQAENDFCSNKINYINSKIEFIRVIKGTNFDYFSDKSKEDFFSKKFSVTKLTDRMGMRLKGPKIKNIVDTNIKSEGLIKGVIQVPPDGDPIIMLSDHGTIGGYPKIGVVISADYDKLIQLTASDTIKFKQVEISEAENLFQFYDLETKNILNQIK
tara:strand:- start:1153 stop:2103 length:951 start_codon:yes stop_codon:yes gene_type:complete